MSDTPTDKKRFSPIFIVILIILGLVVAFALYLILNAEHIKLTGMSFPWHVAFRGANNWVQAMPGCAFCLFLSRWLDVPGPCRRTTKP